MLWEFGLAVALAPVNRRLVTIPAALLLAGLAAGCTTFDSSDTAARVGDDTLDNDTLTALVEALPSPATGQPQGDPSNADDVRNSITLWVQSAAINQYVEDEGIDVSDESVAAAEELLSTQLATYADAPQAARQVLLDYFSATNALGELGAADEAQIIEIYEQGPVESGIVCAAHILVETEEEAAEVVAELEAGADFSELASERTIDPSGQGTGGALPCTSTPGFASNYVPEFVEAALDLDVGEYSEPVESDFGYHVILLRPFDETIAAELAGYFASADFRIGRALAAADISVKPRYGTITDTYSVVPLG
jgi:peptidyl-prolyl cis-trans isomerase C